VFGVYKNYFSHYQNYVEAGLRYDVRSITTLFSDSILNFGMPAFTKTKGSLNGSLATNIWLVKKILSLQANIGSGYRSGNLAELSSNGLHEGTSRWEVGNPNLKIEQNINSEIGIGILALNKTINNCKKINLNFSINAFHNQFYNYIYLAPTSRQYYGFTIYNYVQSNAALQGSEVILNGFFNEFKKGILIYYKSEFTYLQAKKADGTYLPFIPPSKLYDEIKIVHHGNQFFLIGLNNVFAQNKPSVFETSTPAYYTMNAAIGKEWKTNDNNKIYSLSITGTNLTDTKYFDHLSRFKYYGIYNIGRNITVNFSIKF
jgi:iron complex outermembrane receptor protein